MESGTGMEGVGTDPQVSSNDNQNKSFCYQSHLSFRGHGLSNNIDVSVGL